MKIAEYEARVGHVELAKYAILTLMFEINAYCDLVTSIPKLWQSLAVINVMIQNWLVQILRRQNFIVNKTISKKHRDCSEVPKSSIVN